MTEKEKEFKLGAITLSIREYIYAFKRLKRVAGSEKSTRNKVLFYSNSINNYISSYFLIDDAFVFKTLKETGLSNLGEPIKKVLDIKVGNTTYGEIVRQLRNKTFVHEGYSSGKINDIFFNAGLYGWLGNKQLANSHIKMFKEIVKLQNKLLRILPKHSGY